MVDDRPEDTGTAGRSGRPKREPPTIDLEATEVSDDAEGRGRGARRWTGAAAEPAAAPGAPRVCVHSRFALGDRADLRRSRRRAGDRRRLGAGLAGRAGAATGAATQCRRDRRSHRAHRRPRSKPNKPAAPVADPAAAARIEAHGKIVRRAARRTHRRARAGGQACLRRQRREIRAARRRRAGAGSVCRQRAHRRSSSARREAQGAEIAAIKTARQSREAKPADDVPLAPRRGGVPARCFGAARRSLCRGAWRRRSRWRQCRCAEAARRLCGVGRAERRQRCAASC